MILAVFLGDAAERRLSTHTTDRKAVALAVVALGVKIAGIEVQVARVATVATTARCRRPVVPAASAIVKRPLIVAARANER